MIDLARNSRLFLAAVAAASSVALAQAPHHYIAKPLPPGYVPPASPLDSTLDMDWNTMDNGGGPLTNGSLLLEGTFGQPDAGHLSNGDTEIVGGFWALETQAPCYANCDESTTPPVLNVGDFTCFLQKYAAGDAYANCDGSTQAPVLNIGDFTCFLQRYAEGCP